MFSSRPLATPIALALAVGLPLVPIEAQQQGAFAQRIQVQNEATAALLAPDALRVLVCGSASPLGADPKREQACLAVIAGPRVFVVDVGSGSNNNLSLAGIPMRNLEAVLLTHFHSDHIGALGDVNLSSWVGGRDTQLEVVGPPGVERVVAGFNEAFALDRSYRTAHHGEDLLPPAVGTMKARSVEPGVILQDAGLKITAIEVDHEPVTPAYGYRFDYLGRSVTISGDSDKSATLIEGARGSDILFHDTMAEGILQTMEGAFRAAGNERTAKIVLDVQDYHATVQEVAETATAAGVKMTVFYHLVPNPANPMVLAGFRAGAPENTVIAADGMLFTLAKDGEEIERTTLFER